MVMLAGVAVLAAAGCGGGSDDEGSLTRGQYVKQANALCATEGQKISKAVAAFTRENGNKTPSKAQVSELMEDVIVVRLRSEFERLRDLSAPEGDEAQLEAIVDGFEAGIEEAGNDPKKLFNEGKGEYAKALEKAKAYGLEACGTLFA